MIDLSENTCTNREQRARGINVYCDRASELVRDAKCGKLQNRERKFQQASGCVLNFYLSVRVDTIQNAAAICHAP
jgi:nitrogenase molybdenum-iron protein alpha chain